MAKKAGESFGKFALLFYCTLHGLPHLGDGQFQIAANSLMRRPVFLLPLFSAISSVTSHPVDLHIIFGSTIITNAPIPTAA